MAQPLSGNPYTDPQNAAGTRTYDIAPMFEGGGGFGTGGGDTYGTSGVNAGSLGGNLFSYVPEPSGAQEGGGFSQPADALAEQARARLAGLMGGGDTAPVEQATKDLIGPPALRLQRRSRRLGCRGAARAAHSG